MYLKKIMSQVQLYIYGQLRNAVRLENVEGQRRAVETFAERERGGR